MILRQKAAITINSDSDSDRGLLRNTLLNIENIEKDMSSYDDTPNNLRQFSEILDNKPMTIQSHENNKPKITCNKENRTDTNARIKTTKSAPASSS